MSKVFGIADPHFNHTRIIEYCNRPWETVENMNQQLIENWNSVVEDNDTVWVLGDFGFGSFESLQTIISQLKGDKKLLCSLKWEL
jgi:calcineurin-like phosphoesterase family protein